MTMQTAQGRGDGLGQLYLDLTVTSTPFSNPRFLVGSQRFYSTNAAGSAPVNPVVLGWGGFQSGLSMSIGDEGGAQITLDANAYLIPANSTRYVKVAQWLRELQFRETEVSLYQWNATESSQELMWKGYIIGITDSTFVDGVHAVEITLSGNVRDMESTTLSDILNKTDFSAAPIGELGRMVPRWYGPANDILSSTDVGGGRARVGFGMAGVRGVIVDEGQSTAKIKVRFAKNDGVSAVSSFPTGTADDAGSYGALWIYDQQMGLYGMVDAGSYTVTNTSSYTEVTVDAVPKVFFFLKPKKTGSTLAAALTDAYKVIDSDPNNHSDSTTTDYTWAFYLPSVRFSGRVKSLGLIVDWKNGHATKNRQISVGIWDIYETGGANWLGGGARLLTGAPMTKLPGDPRIISMGGTAAFRYEQSSFGGGGGAGAHKGSSTRSDFANGTFITFDTADANLATLEMRITVDELGGLNAGRESVQLFNVGIAIEVDYSPPAIQPGQFQPHGYYEQYEDFQRDRNRLYLQYHQEVAESKEKARAFVLGADWFARGAGQKDDGSGTYTGSAAAVIQRVSDIAYHVLAALSGQTVNATAATLGNFVDPRSNGVLKDLNVLNPFGPDVVKRKQALDRLQDRFPIRLHRKAGTWRCIPDDMNPHSSRFYRSTSEPIEIGPNDFERDSFRDREIDSSDFVNAVQLNYSHGYPDREAVAQYVYENPLSQKWFGKKTTEPFNYPELVQTSLESGADAGVIALAQWLGRRVARPRRVIDVSVFQKFYDLEAGHVLTFGDLASVGIQSQAFRSGLPDYYFNSASGGTDYADSLATVLISLTSSSAVIGLSQQTDGLNFSIATAAAFTSVANAWRYSASGGTFSNFANIVNTNALKSTGVQRVSWDRPNLWDWLKTELTLGGVTYGPCYWIQFNYSTPVTAGLANDLTTYTASYRGRLFEVIKSTRRPGRRSKDYPYKDVTLLEVA